eukprot:2846058-Rhodomonas_salina.1
MSQGQQRGVTAAHASFAPSLRLLLLAVGCCAVLAKLALAAPRTFSPVSICITQIVWQGRRHSSEIASTASSLSRESRSADDSLRARPTSQYTESQICCQ